MNTVKTEPLTPEQLAEVDKLLSAGKTVAAIAREFGVRRHVLVGRIRRSGYEVSQRLRAIQPVSMPATDS